MDKQAGSTLLVKELKVVLATFWKWKVKYSSADRKAILRNSDQTRPDAMG